MKLLPLVYLAAASLPLFSAEPRTIPNPLGQDWPWELVSMDFPAGSASPDWVATIEGVAEPRPVQIEKAEADGKPVDRLWFIATVGSKQKSAAVSFAPGSATSPLKVLEDGDFTLVDNGVAELRLRLGNVGSPTPLAKVPHWLGGLRVKGTGVWDGRAWFDGSSQVTAVTAKQVAQGPVFAEWLITYEFADPGTEGEVEAVKLMTGKQSFRYEPDKIPAEKIPKQERRYEVAVRAVAGDPWIEVVERYRLPSDPSVANFEIHQYMLQFGNPEGAPKDLPGFKAGEGMPVDSVLWVRWFDYDAFGGNNNQVVDPARPRATQKGRPFAQLRARWAQSPSGAQEAIFTSEGAGSPAAGVVAAYPSKWVGPYDATITVQAFDGNRGTFRFPLVNGGRHAHTQQPIHYGGRSWALIAAPRSAIEGTATIDSLVRRHTDWTLTALVNRYILDWPGMGAGKVGPNPSQYLQRRYQADDVNPTNYGTRRLINGEFEKNIARGAEFGPQAAVAGYICTDLDAWPGWHNGWGPGNPNFHTDKYMGSIFAAATMPNHPHAKDWLAFGRSCLDADLAKVILPPDGVGSECPGYAGYALDLQSKLVEALVHANLGNPFTENPLVVKNLTWHRKLLTPFDRRLGFRHGAPIGDTHRWTSGAKFGTLVPFFEKQQPKVAEELRLADALTKAKGPGAAGAEKIDWSSQAFKGFGTILRHRFGEPEESFLSLKSGSTTGHYHNDDQSFHWYHRGTPVALDYNCSYHPRGDHAALHNTITLGQSGRVKHNARNEEVAAIEQPFGPADVVTFQTTPTADLVVAERKITALSMSPLDPHDSEFNRSYPERKIDALHRRTLLLAKQPAGSPLSDYLVVRDDIQTTEPQQVNFHLLARDARVDGATIRLTGQWDQDILVKVVESTGLKVGVRRWQYIDEHMAPPEPYLPQPGESADAWAKRLGPDIPAADWKPTYLKREQLADNEKRWHDLIESTNGAALMPPPGWKSTWTYGEVQQWLRIESAPGTPLVTVLYPTKRGTPEPTITREGDVIVIQSGNATDRIAIGKDRVLFNNQSLLPAP